MEQNEMIKIFDDSKNELGVATRAEVHKNGYWHETFHCWFISREKEKHYIYLQKRSHAKKDYPNLLDITAAGHILAHESMEDGVREVKEETGIDVAYENLVPLGTIDYCVVREDIGFIDKEIAHVFLFECEGNLEEFIVPIEEVSGMYKIELQCFSDFWIGGETEVYIEGFELNEVGEKTLVHTKVDRNSFVPHENSYYERIILLINEFINTSKV